MQTFIPMVGGLVLALLMTMAGAAQAATFVYVSNAEDGDIGVYTLQPDGSLEARRARQGRQAGDADDGQPRQAISLSPRCARSPSRPTPTPSTARPAR